MSVYIVFSTLSLLLAILSLILGYYAAGLHGRVLRYVAITSTALLLLVEELRWQLFPIYALALLLVTLMVVKSLRNKSGHGIHSNNKLIALGRWSSAFVVIVISSVAIASSALFPMLRLPQPTGVHSVGSTILYLSDITREEKFSERSGSNRELRVRVWYPTDAFNNADTMPYWLDSEEQSRELTKVIGLPDFLFTHLGVAKTNASFDAPIATSTSPFPVVLFSHGAIVGYAEQNTVLMEELASHGYVLFSIDHSYMSLYSEFPNREAVTNDLFLTEYSAASDELDGEDIQKIEDSLQSATSLTEITELASELLEATPIATNMYADVIRTWSEDHSFVLDELEKLNSMDPIFQERLDLDNVGIIGMSMGAFTTFSTIANDSRIVAGINLDGYSVLNLDHAPIEKPYMYMDSNQYFLPPQTHQMVANNLKHRPGYLLAIDSAEHYNFSDVGLFAKALFSISGQLGEIDPLRMSQIVNNYSLAFLDTYLKNQSSDLLAGTNSDYPEVDFFLLAD